MAPVAPPFDTRDPPPISGSPASIEIAGPDQTLRDLSIAAGRSSGCVTRRSADGNVSPVSPASRRLRARSRNAPPAGRIAIGPPMAHPLLLSRRTGPSSVPSWYYPVPSRPVTSPGYPAAVTAVPGLDAGRSPSNPLVAPSWRPTGRSSIGGRVVRDRLPPRPIRLRCSCRSIDDRPTVVTEPAGSSRYASTALAAPRIARSPNLGPISWSPTGRSSASPAGTEIAGRFARFTGTVSASIR